MARVKQLTSNILFDSLEKLKSSSVLWEGFQDIFTEFDEAQEEIVSSLFEELTSVFIRVANNEFRKSLTGQLGKKEKVAT